MRRCVRPTLPTPTIFMWLVQWVVQVYGNGKCTIKNAKEDLFLSWDKQTKGVFKAGKSAEQRIWIVKDIGGYTYA